MRFEGGQAAPVFARLLVALGGLLLASALHAEKLSSLAPSKPAPANERRVALVIGNSAYKVSPLRNPVNDARAMARALSETGFSVALVEDATLAGMRRAAREFGNDIARGGVGLFYYAGHGIQLRGRNYLIPVNADVQAEDEVEDQAMDANFVLSKMDSARNALNIMVLDACRNNPFQRSFRSTAQGLAQMDAPSGTLISFATSPGSVAADGAGDNGVYTSHLLAAIPQRGLPIEQLFKQVRIGVSRDTGGRQIPWESTSLKGDFFFLPLDPSDGPAAQQVVIQRAVTDAVRAAEEKAALERAEMQRRMEQMIQDALAKQKAQLEAEKKGIAAAPVPAAPIPAQPVAQAASMAPPVQVAVIAPSLALKSGKPGMPGAGDRWLYRGFDVDHEEKKFEVAVEVVGAADSGVIEIARATGGRTTQWTYSPEPVLVGISTGFVMFAPYIGAFKQLSVGQSWSNNNVERLKGCTSGCQLEGKVVAKEKVTVAAGEFEAYRIVVSVRGGTYFGWRSEYTYWYSAEAKRIVKYKFRSRGSSSNMYIPDPDTDFELVAYQLDGQPVGKAAAALVPLGRLQ